MTRSDERMAASLIRQVVAGQLSEAELASQWPEPRVPSADLENSRRSVEALLGSRRSGDRELAQLLGDDLLDVAAKLDIGGPLEWFDPNPPWLRFAHGVLIAGVLVVSAGIRLFDWPWWTLLVAVILYFPLGSLIDRIHERLCLTGSSPS